MKKSIKNQVLSGVSVFISSLLLVSFLTACSSSSSGPAPDEVASGLYKNGTAELNSGVLMLNDLRAFVYNDRIIMFSIAEHLLFDGQITDIAGDDFSATVDVYDTGAIAQQGISVTGKVTSQSQITGTLAGTGAYSGSFTLTFDSAYSSGATIEKIRDKPSNWLGDILTTFSDLNDVGASDSLDVWDDSGTNALAYGIIGDSQACDAIGTVSIPDSQVNIYSLTHDIPSGTTLNNTYCPSSMLDPANLYTGFAAVLSESMVDNDLFFAVTNGEYAIFGLLNIP